MYERVKTDGVTPDIVLDLFKSKFPKEDYNSVFGPDSKYDDNRQVCSSVCSMPLL